jgi:hypothetical protein
MKIVMLCCDEPFGELATEVLAHHELDIISDYALIKTTPDMYAVFQHDSYDLLILTNMGIPSALAMRHVTMLPEIRTYRTILVSGYLTDAMKYKCNESDVATLNVPVKPQQLREAVDGRIPTEHKKTTARRS